MAAASDTDVNFDIFDFDSLATRKKYIDKGVLGEVYGPFDWNHKKFALKRILISQDAIDTLEMKVKEKKSIWMALKHKNLLEIHHVSLKENAIYLVMEYAGGGSLSRFLHKSAVSFQVSNFARQIAEGMMFLHAHGVVHRDLKPGNTMIMDSCNDHKQMILKITDFDEVKEYTHTTTMSLRGTCAYMAPEVLENQWVSTASDVWSYGVLVWEMLTREIPHAGLQLGSLAAKAISGRLVLDIRESIPDAYKKLLHYCLCHDRNGRPSFKEIIQELSNIDSSEAIGEPCQYEEEMEVDEGQAVQRQIDYDEPHGKYQSKPVLIHTIMTKTIEEMTFDEEELYSPGDEIKNSVSGMTILDSELFVVYRKSSEVKIYDAMKFSLSRRWNLKESIDPLDIASCSTNKCIYIYNYKDDCQSDEILRVSPNGKLIKEWSTKGDFGNNLSVTCESNVILVVIKEHKLNEYLPNGQFIREIYLSKQRIYEPMHAVKLANGHFVVSHYNKELHRVCIVDADGNLKKSFGGTSGATIEQMNCPYYLAVDGNGFVMVSDQENHRILLLDSDLKLKREILSEEEHKLESPGTILLDEKRGRLLVRNWKSKYREILIFDL